MNHVSTQIALRLEKAGFPQPATALAAEGVYHPDAGEILQELPDFSLKAVGNGWGFYCYRLDPNRARWSLNAADACALVWLVVNEKK